MKECENGVIAYVHIRLVIYYFLIPGSRIPWFSSKPEVSGKTATSLSHFVLGNAVRKFEHRVIEEIWGSETMGSDWRLCGCIYSSDSRYFVDMDHVS